ncbi:MAG: tyrosine-type recombinase/integrase [Hylemonella sp.]|nr:tyrosine-type recombinase/integrase [Hylemonella sp.]
MNRYMALVRSILRRACYDWEWTDRVPKVGMMRQAEGRVRSLTREEFVRLLAELPPHLADMARFSVATGLRQANVKRLQWKQISLERRHLWIAADQHKNGKAHAFPLNSAAMEVSLKRQADHSIYVLSTRGCQLSR